MHTTKGEMDSSNKLKIFLSDTFVLYMKTYAVHWNFEGPNFFSVHKLTEAQYEELALAVDEIAERIRALGFIAPVSLDEVLQSNKLNEFSRGPSNKDALKSLVMGHRKLSSEAIEMAQVLNQENDPVTADIFIGRAKSHDKSAWILNSLLG